MLNTACHQNLWAWHQDCPPCRAVMQTAGILPAGAIPLLFLCTSGCCHQGRPWPHNLGGASMRRFRLGDTAPAARRAESSWCPVCSLLGMPSAEVMGVGLEQVLGGLNEGCVQVVLSSEGPKVERESGYRYEPFVILSARGGSKRRNLSESGPESGAETAASFHCSAGSWVCEEDTGHGDILRPLQEKWASTK